MKNILLFLVILILSSGCSVPLRTEINPDEKNYSFEEELTQTKAIAFEAAEEWIYVNLINSKNMVQLIDKSEGKIIVKPRMTVDVGTKLPMNYTLVVKITEGKIYFNFEIGEMAIPYGGYPPESSIKEIKNDFIKIKDDILDKIKNYKYKSDETSGFNATVLHTFGISSRGNSMPETLKLAYSHNIFSAREVL